MASDSRSSRDRFIPEKIISQAQIEGRLGEFVHSFKKSYNGASPTCIVRCPGRINLIGDHIDYHGFPVIPMAIENSIWLGCSFEPKVRGDNGAGSILEIANIDSETYPNYRESASSINASDLEGSHSWHNYILCGFYGVIATDLLDIHSNDLPELAKDKGFTASCAGSLESVAHCKMLVDSSLPVASGLSSSSALVCASAIATSLLLRHSNLTASPRMDSLKIANSCSRYENLVGTQGGGMDQAIIMTAQEGFAKYVKFSPLECENVRLPETAVWLVSHCGVSFSKASTSNFNTRVLETKLAAALVAKAKGTCKGASAISLDKTISLRKIKEEFYREHSLQELKHDINSNIFENRTSFTVDDICDRLDMTRDQLAERFHIKEMTTSELHLAARCEHVLDEADRVAQFKSICDTTADIEQLGRLMTQSHNSLRDKFDCSHPALDKLVNVALDAGASGSRLTGAGWGGCIISLVPASRRNIVLERLKKVSKITFETRPYTGCEVFWLDPQT